MAVFASKAFDREGYHAWVELVDKLGVSTLGAREFARCLAAGEAPLAAVLPELRPGEGILDFLQVATAAQVSDGCVELAAARAMLPVFALHAPSREVGADLVPLLVLVAVKGLHLLALCTCGIRRKTFCVCRPIDFLTLEELKQQLGAFRDTAAEEPEREWPEDQAVVAGANSAGSDGTDGGVYALVHVQVQHDRPQCLALARMRSDCKGRRQRDLTALHLEQGRFAPAVQIPIFFSRAHGVDAWFIDALQLPSRALEFHIDASGRAVGLLIVLRPDPGVHPANGALE